jgi:exosortase A-associated hydrolase 2
VLDAFFIPVEPGQRFWIFHSPTGTSARGGMVYVQPFGDEMNKARRMAALQARRLAAEGWSVLQIDLYGCGDSAGEFAQARWEIWSRDVRAAMAWLSERVAGPLSLWGLRLGATLACEVARERAVEALVLWQPVVAGEQLLTQFLRTRLAGEMLAGGAATTALKQLRAELARGRTLEVAGYELHPELAAAIERVDLIAMRPAAKRIHWMEVAPEPGSPLRSASRRVVEAWRSAGVEVAPVTVAGEPFWSTIEIAECEALLDATSEALR